MIGDNQHSFSEGNLHLKNLVALYDKVTVLIGAAEQLTSSTGTAKHLTLSCRTALSQNWREMDLMGGTLTG